MTPSARARIHAALDRLIARRQWERYAPDIIKGSAWTYPAPRDYERLDAGARR